MKYLVDTSAIIDVTKPPYCADNTGKTDCTEILRKVFDDVMIRQVEELRATYDKLIELSDNKREDVFLGIEGGRVENGTLSITFPENEPSNKIIYFPKGTYLVSDTVTYTLDDLKGFWYWVPEYENNRNIHILGESREETIIRLADNSKGFEKGSEKPVVSFVNNEMKVPRDKEFTNVAFMNTLEDITIDCGKGNVGAVGVKYTSSNCGRIENVNIKTQEGHSGIYVANNTTQAVFAKINISGFDYGIDIERSVLMALDEINVSGNKFAGIYTGSSTVNCNKIISGDIPAIKFRESNGLGRYYLINSEISLDNSDSGCNINFEKNGAELRGNGIPENHRSSNPEDWALVDDFGAVGDGKTDSTKAIQKAMNSGKSVIVFGEGEYLINRSIKIPETVKTVDFLFCSLASGSRLVGGEYDCAFEVAEDSDDLLFIENLSAWEKFKGHIRLVKHNAKRDIVISDIHLMTASLYFNTVEGSKVYLDNCFLTTGTYTRTSGFPSRDAVPVYSRIIPYEFHGQKVYGRVINPERADIAMLNDNSRILIDGYRIEGSGTALKSVNGGTTQFNLFNAGIGAKIADNPVFHINNSSFELNEAIIFGFDAGSEYNDLIVYENDGEKTVINWNDAQSFSDHGKYIENYCN